MNEKTRTKKKVSGRPALWVDPPLGWKFCPGCHHSIIERAILETVDELGLGGKSIAVIGIGCGAFFVKRLNLDNIYAAHGRAADVSTAIKRVHPDCIVFTMQGDGDCFSIGAGPLMGALTRAENITVFMFNNGHFGMTGGQMAPTTIEDHPTTTTPKGRNPSLAGYPAHVPELIAPMKAVTYTARGAVNNPSNFQRTKGYIKTALKKQMEGDGLSFVEILSACPTHLHMSPVDSLKWMENEMIPEFPLGEFKNID